MKRILHMVGTMDLGGQETLIMNVYKNIDRSKCQFDFVVQSNNKGYYDDTIKAMGGNIYVISRLSKNPIKHCTQLAKIFKSKTYSDFHRHTNSSIVVFDVLVARICKIKNIIVHCHSTKSNRSAFSHYVFRPFLNLFRIKRVACSKSAGTFMFGKKEFSVINNGINMEKFYFDLQKRVSIRNEYDLSNENIIIGHVGRFTKEKNHSFIIDFFERVKTINSNCLLLLIGDGPERNNIEKLAYEKNLYDSILFLGNKDNTYDYYQMMDLFVFPSKYEGLGISLIEAQASGLNCFASNNIPEEAILTNRVWQFPIDSIDDWISCFKNIDFSIEKRPVYNKNDKIYTYDISKTVQDFYKLYNL